GAGRENDSAERAYQNSSSPRAGNRFDAQRGIEAIAGGGPARKLCYDRARGEIGVLSEDQLGKWSGDSLSLAHYVLGHDNRFQRYRTLPQKTCRIEWQSDRNY